MRQLFSLTLSVLLFSFIVACSQQAPKPPAAPPADLSKVETPANGEIDSAAAVTAISRWDTLRPSIQDALAKGGNPSAAAKVPLGFEVPKADIMSLASILPPSATHLYAMLSLQNDSLGRTQLTLIFQAEDRTGKLRYYDFSEPCPPCEVTGFAD